MFEKQGVDVRRPKNSGSRIHVKRVA
jgi:hypothetical protein